MIRAVFVYTVFFLLASLTSCRVDFETPLSTSIDEDVPEFSLNRAKMTIVEEEITTIEVDRLQYFPSDGRQEMDNLRFSQRKQDGTIMFEGSVERLVLDKNEDMSMEGSTRIYAKEEEALLTGSFFVWDESEQTLDSKEEVSIERGDGSAMKGRGFLVQADSNTVKFLEDSEGRLYSAGEEQDDEAEEEQDDE